MQQSVDPDGAVRLALLGELDLDALVDRLLHLEQDGANVRLDVPRLTFLDLRALHAMIVASFEARRDVWNIGISHEVSDSVRRVIDLADAGSLLWPET